MDGWMDGWMCGGLDALVGGRTDELIYGYTWPYGWICGCEATCRLTRFIRQWM